MEQISAIGKSTGTPGLLNTEDMTDETKDVPQILRVVQPQQDDSTKILISALQPDASMMERILADPQLLQGFDDPEVLAAVTELSLHPDRISKYSANPKARSVTHWTQSKRFL